MRAIYGILFTYTKELNHDKWMKVEIILLKKKSRLRKAKNHVYICVWSLDKKMGEYDYEKKPFVVPWFL